MNIRDFLGVVRELSFTEIRHEAMVPPRILLYAPDQETGSSWRAKIFGEDSVPFIEVESDRASNVDPLAFDAIVSIGTLSPDLSRRWADLFRRANEEMRLVEVQTGQMRSDDDLENLRRVVCDLCRDRSVAFGRYMEQMRTAATCEIIADTSRVNAQFAALSNIPALIPLVGGIFAAGADFLVLTKNQLMMMYRLAAIYDRDLDDRWRIYSELAPIVGFGFLWRTTARQIAAIIPFALAAVPKVVIAFAGTYAIGQAARVYYERGEKLTGEELSQVYKEGLDALDAARYRLGLGANQKDRPADPAIAVSTERT
ncbi:MAG: hypothetical protein WD401_06860 [Thermomicrobiaceae bacterium]